MKPNRKSHTRLKICCAITTTILVLLVVVLLILYFVVLKPKEPVAIADPVLLTKIDFFMFPQMKLNITLALVVHIDNRNYGSFKFKNTTAYVTYRGNPIAEAPILADKIPAREKHNVSTSVEITVDKLILDPQFLHELHGGSLNFTSLTTLQGKVNVFNILKMKAKILSMCDIIVFVQSRTANSTCHSKGKL